jgi:hypothetical protein
MTKRAASRQKCHVPVVIAVTAGAYPAEKERPERPLVPAFDFSFLLSEFQFFWLYLWLSRRFFGGVTDSVPARVPGASDR